MPPSSPAMPRTVSNLQPQPRKALKPRALFLFRQKQHARWLPEEGRTFNSNFHQFPQHAGRCSDLLMASRKRRPLKPCRKGSKSEADTVEPDCIGVLGCFWWNYIIIVHTSIIIVTSIILHDHDSYYYCYVSYKYTALNRALSAFLSHWQRGWRFGHCLGRTLPFGCGTQGRGQRVRLGVQGLWLRVSGFWANYNVQVQRLGGFRLVGQGFLQVHTGKIRRDVSSNQHTDHHSTKTTPI